ncbi:Nucleoporin NDC1 [Golovinomyces cichoracearum]|uniref:Nucleoporin NDC1 n=1 Tax=Golovinomyces cichoracearum TaxID=62708 RepID=A0A420HJK1_9PEZI|nr:Nucleoporin NDC1 [Golovinomyces cichoracearum]
MPQTTKICPYKDYLTPALHRRFIAALTVCFFFCYIESIIIGDKSSLFWVWFPLSKTGLRAGLLFAPALCIFLLRVAQLHVGIRTSVSGWNTFKSHAFRFQTVQTATWYCISAYLFSEIYIWSASADAGLSRIKSIPRTTRSTLNENPIYLISFFFFLAISQTAAHLIYDYDRIDIPVNKLKVTRTPQTGEALSAFQKLKVKIPSLALTSVRRSVLLTLISPFIYASNLLFYPYSIRRLAWSLNRTWAKLFWTLPKSSSLPTVWPFHWSVLWTGATSGCLLIFLWEVSSAAFSLYTAEQPLKDGRTITQKSRDPIGSLLIGLKSRKLQTKVFAFWELFYITHNLKSYRKSIFDDIDRVGGSSWSQVRDACIDVITDVLTRIDNYESPSISIANISETIPSLPRLSEPLKEGLDLPGDIFNAVSPPSSPMRGVARAVGKFAKSKGQSSPTGPSPKTKKLIQAAENMILNEKQKQALTKSNFSTTLKRWGLIFLQSHLGWPFRQEYRRVMATIVLGTPYGEVGLIVDAIESLARLAVCSLTEDQFGNVQRDIKVIIVTFTTTIMKLENFRNSVGLHWTDVMAVQESPETDQILNSLKFGLKNVVDAFEKYSENLGLSQRELRIAKELTSPPSSNQKLEMK